MRGGVVQFGHHLLLALTALGCFWLQPNLKSESASGHDPSIQTPFVAVASYTEPAVWIDPSVHHAASSSQPLGREGDRDPLAHPSRTLAGRGGAGDPAAPHWMSFRATWYSPFDGPGQGTVTATGSHVKDQWTIAVDPRVIPLGSIVEIRFPDGRAHTYQAQDTGGAIHGFHIDIYDTSRAECLRNGVQRVMVRIVKTKP